MGSFVSCCLSHLFSNIIEMEKLLASLGVIIQMKSNKVMHKLGLFQTKGTVSLQISRLDGA